MSRRIWVAVVVIASAILFGGVAQGRSAHPGVIPSGTISCSTEFGQEAYTAPGVRNVAPAAGGFNETLIGAATGCTGNAGNPVIGAYFKGPLEAPAGPRTCAAADATGTYTGGTNTFGIQWWTYNAVTGQQVFYSSTSHTLTNATTAYPTVTVTFAITAGAFAGNTVTLTENITAPNAAAFAADCNTGGVRYLKGTAVTGTLSVP
jgi:hypothetical protein